MRDLAHKTHKSISSLIQRTLDPLIALEKKIKMKLGNYIQEQRIKEQKAREEALRIVEEKRLAEATDLEIEGKYKEAEEVIAMPMRIRSEEKPIDQGGTYTVTTWSVEVVSMKELIKAVNDGIENIQLLMPNYQLLNNMARVHKDKLDIPGVKAISSTIIKTRLGV